MSIEESIVKHVCIGDTVTYRDNSGNTASGKCVGWETQHSGQRYLLINEETPIPLYRILSRQRNGQELQFRRSPAILST